MVKKLYLLYILGTFICITSCGQKNDKKEMTVAFYNCENFFDNKHEDGKNDEDFTPEGKYHYTDRIYHQKLHNIATVIQQIGKNDVSNLAIMGLSEVENDQVLNDLTKQPEIAGNHYQYVWFNGPDRRGINVALLYDPSYFHVLNAEPLHVSLQKAGDSFSTRDVLHVFGVLGSDTVHVFVNHWPSRLGGEEESEQKREIAASVDRNYIKNIFSRNVNAKIIIMGDLNDNPTDSSVTYILGAKGDKQNVNDTELYNPWLNIYTSGIGTLEYKHQWDLFDQIMISGAFLTIKPNNLHFDKAEIFKPDFLIDHYKRSEGYPHRSFIGTHWINGYSDHFPVVMYLAIGA